MRALVLGALVVLIGCSDGMESMPKTMLRVEGRTFAMGTDPAEVPRLMEDFGITSPERFAPVGFRCARSVDVTRGAT